MLPVSWTTIDERHNQLYYSISHNVDGRYETSYWILPTDFKNYNGTTLADAMMGNMNDGLYDNMKGTFKVNIGYNYIENQFKVEIMDSIPVNIQHGDII